MKAPRCFVVSLVLLTFAGIAYAGAGPTSPLYLTTGGANILVVQGNSVQSIPEAYASPNENPIAVYGDVRTIGQHVGWPGGQYTLGGAPTGTSYAMPPGITSAYDSTSDGAHNYLVEYFSGTVFQTARDFTNAVAIFTTPTNISYPFGITYDAANNSLWISYAYDLRVFDYSLNGTLLSSFSTGHYFSGALAFDRADQTLWLVNDTWNGTAYDGTLEQYSTAGVLLSTGPYVGYADGGEFDLGPSATPEPGTLIMFGSGILGFAGVLRRKINL